jgi:uncharacterized membrane protein
VSEFLRTLHVVAAVLLIGPLLAAPFVAWWAIRRRDAETVRFAANQMALFGAGTLVVAGLGLATLVTGDEWTTTTPWVLVAATLFVVALGLIWGYAVPGLRRAASLVAEENASLTVAQAPVPAAAPQDSASPSAGATPAPTSPGEAGALAGAGAPAEPASPPEATAGDVRRMHRLDRITARVTGAGWLLLATFTAITVLMAVRPFD